MSHFRKPSDFDLEFGNILFNFFLCYVSINHLFFFGSWESLSTIYVDFSIFLTKKKMKKKMKNSHVSVDPFVIHFHVCLSPPFII